VIDGDGGRERWCICTSGFGLGPVHLAGAACLHGALGWIRAVKLARVAGTSFCMREVRPLMACHWYIRNGYTD
jgi:hypothetical protein